MAKEIIQESPLKELFAALQFCVIERTGEGRFRVLAPPPEWFSRQVPDCSSDFEPAAHFPFLESFLLEADDFWKGGGREILRSGPWVQTTPEDTEAHLEASVLLLDQRQILLIRELGQSYSERRDLLQKARENSLTYQRLLKEVQMKEVLLHCIVHDLAGPLTGVKGLFSLLTQEELSERGRRFLKIGEDAATRLENLMNDILAVFSAEVESLESFSSDPESAPDLNACARSVVGTLQPAATVRGIDLRLETRLETVLKVAGETTRLERVLFNLLENALRHSPRGGAVVITARSENGWVRTAVSDEGPGIAPEVQPKLFEKFQQGGRTFGKAGLGLYFCRIVVEKWGGKIGYETRPEGGSRFWFTLPSVAGSPPAKPAVPSTADD